MSDQSDRYLDGKGSEMLPERGNPFDREIKNQTDRVEDAIRAWENERSGDLSTGAQGRSSRQPKPVPIPSADAQSAFQENPQKPASSPSRPADSKTNNAPHTPPPPQTIAEPAQPQETEPPGDQSSHSLLERAEDAHWKINDLIDHLGTASQLLNKIKQAKSLIQAGNDDDGELLINEVEYRIHLAGRNKAWAKREAKRVISYEVMWLTALLTLLYLLPKGTIEAPALEMIYSALVAAVGSVLSMMYASSRQLVTQKDAPPYSNLWFIIQPITAMIIGGFIHLAFGFFGQSGFLGQEGIDPPYLIYLIAGLAGFFQVHLFGLRSRA